MAKEGDPTTFINRLERGSNQLDFDRQWRQSVLLEDEEDPLRFYPDEVRHIDKEISLVRSIKRMQPLFYLPEETTREKLPPAKNAQEVYERYKTVARHLRYQLHTLLALAEESPNLAVVAPQIMKNMFAEAGSYLYYADQVRKNSLWYLDKDLLEDVGRFPDLSFIPFAATKTGWFKDVEVKKRNIESVQSPYVDKVTDAYISRKRKKAPTYFQGNICLNVALLPDAPTRWYVCTTASDTLHHVQFYGDVDKNNPIIPCEMPLNYGFSGVAIFFVTDKGKEPEISAHWVGEYNMDWHRWVWGSRVEQKVG